LEEYQTSLWLARGLSFRNYSNVVNQHSNDINHPCHLSGSSGQAKEHFEGIAE
jgi:hypothetical protein